MKLLLSVPFLGSFLQLISCTTVFSEYYVINKGFLPTKMEGSAISYDVFLTPGKPSEKRICGYWKVHRRIEKLAMHITMERKTTGVGGLVNSGDKIIVDNLCNCKFPMEPFLEKFNGTLDETCSLDAGFYRLCNWTFEEHMKKVIPKMLLGEYVFHLNWMENNKDCVLKNDIVMDFRNINEKEAEDRMAGNDKETKKQKKRKDKEGSEKKDKKKGKEIEKKETPWKGNPLSGNEKK